MTSSIFSFSFLPFLQARRDQRPSHSPVSFPTSLQFLRLLWCQRSLHVTLTGLTLCSHILLFTGRSIQLFVDTVVIRNHISQRSIAFVPTILMTLTDTSSTSDAAPINLQHSSDHRPVFAGKQNINYSTSTNASKWQVKTGWTRCTTASNAYTRDERGDVADDSAVHPS